MKPRFAVMKPCFAVMNPRMKYGIATVLVCLLLCMHTAICRATLPDSLFAKHIQPQEKVYLYLDGRAEGVRRNGLSSYINIATGQFRSNLTGRVYNLPGFNRAAEFYNPDYSHATPPDTTYAADHRRTLYWNPDVVTDKYGQAYIEFYGSSVSKALDVSVEGVTKYGEFIVKAR